MAMCTGDCVLFKIPHKSPFLYYYVLVLNVCNLTMADPNGTQKERCNNAGSSSNPEPHHNITSNITAISLHRQPPD